MKKLFVFVATVVAALGVTAAANAEQTVHAVARVELVAYLFPRRDVLTKQLRRK